MRLRQWVICGDSARVRWIVEPRSWTIRLTSSLLAGSAFSMGSTRLELCGGGSAAVKPKARRTPSFRARARRRRARLARTSGQRGHHARELGGLHGLGQVDLEARREHAVAVLALRVRGQGRRGYLPTTLGSERAHAADERIAVLVRHADVAHEH